MAPKVQRHDQQAKTIGQRYRSARPMAHPGHHDWAHHDFPDISLTRRGDTENRESENYGLRMMEGSHVRRQHSLCKAIRSWPIASLATRNVQRGHSDIPSLSPPVSWQVWFSWPKEGTVSQRTIDQKTNNQKNANNLTYHFR